MRIDMIASKKMCSWCVLAVMWVASSTETAYQLHAQTRSPLRQQQEYRTWTSADGKFTVEARLVRVVGQIVYLQRKDNGRGIRVPIGTISEQDRDYLESVVIERSTKPMWGRSATARPTANPADSTVATLRITETVLRPRDKVPPLGANYFGKCGAIEWAANNFVHNSGNEPIHWRNLHRALNVVDNSFEIGGGGVSWYDLWGSGFLSGANVRIYRLVDKAGDRLPLDSNGRYLDLRKADHVAFVGKGRVIPEGSGDFPEGGWVVTKYGNVFPNLWIRHGNLKCTDSSGIDNGRTYWYTVAAVNADNQESELSSQVNATPKAGLDTPPQLLVVDDEDMMPRLDAGKGFTFIPKTCGGEAPYRWQVVDEHDKPLALPAGLRIDAATGSISGKATLAVQDFALWLKVTDAAGRSDVRKWVINPTKPAGAAAAKGQPEPPRDVRAVAGDGCVKLTWKPSPSPNVAGYRIKRSTLPAAKQADRVYLTQDSPKLEPFDYVVIERKFDPFEMRWVHPRVRGIGNPMDAPEWYWRGDLSKLRFSLVPHQKPLPDGIVDPGETCMQVTASQGRHSIEQFVFIGTQHGKESIWYGQLEPGKRYRLEVWLRQQGLGDGGVVTFSYGRGYPDIKHALNVTGEWKEFTFDFTGPERPQAPWHFGHQFTFTGPGTLWMDNCRVFRCDRPEDAEKPLVPNATVLDELLASQPEAGAKGAHRIWFLDRDATMSSILSWHANSKVSPNWRTSVSGTMRMTLPQGLLFDLETGEGPQSRMRPWLVLQHILHSEEDWQALIEYLAAPYDPNQDSPISKPWAYQRYQQRGTAAPWTDEFAEIIIEFGNETWHNGVFPDWLGFGIHKAVHQGGPEYGMFARYLIETIRKSPYWESQGLDHKIRFVLGANYDGRVDPNGQVRGYGEEAMQNCPPASYLGHANYVGPKWETGDKSSSVFDDHGVQQTLLAFLTAVEPRQVSMSQAREQLTKTHHEYDCVAYEGGPSGFAIPGRAAPAQVEVNEQYGKSLAMGVAAFDSWMRSYELGWTYQCYLAYGQGMTWNSHTPLWNGFRPSPGWLALVLRNRYASGDLMQVQGHSIPMFERKSGQTPANYPLIGGYATRDGNRWSVFVVSRKLDGAHDGHDFGDGYWPVTLNLPFKKAERITLHKLTGNPRWNNRDELKVSIQSREVAADELTNGTLVVNEKTGGGDGGMPPGSIFLYVFEEVVK